MEGNCVNRVSSESNYSILEYEEEPKTAKKKKKKIVNILDLYPTMVQLEHLGEV